MKLARVIAATALLLALAATAASAADNNCQPRDPVIKWCPPGNDSTLVPIFFNASLDANLETAFGNAATRNAGFAQAVQDWNQALVAVGAKVRIVLTNDATKWAIDQGDPPPCVDQFDLTAPVYQLAGANHIGNMENAASTGHNHGGAHVDGANNPIGAGWIVPFGTDVSDTTTGFNIDQVLAITVTTLDGQNPMCIAEGDIFWLTHYHLFGENSCFRIRWDYRYPMGPDATRTDYYSVMLHELGHFLGLGHQDADVAGTNVMQAFIPKGTRRVIGPKERACLCALYGLNQCLPTAIPHSSWGEMKVRYR